MNQLPCSCSPKERIEMRRVQDHALDCDSRKVLAKDLRPRPTNPCQGCDGTGEVVMPCEECSGTGEAPPPAEVEKTRKPELEPVNLVTRPCSRCGEPFELGRTDFFRLEYMDHGIWTTLFLCRLRCLREVGSAKDSPVKSRDRLAAAPNRESR